MTSSNGNIFRVTGALWEESTGHLVVSSHKGQWRGALMFSLICAWTNDWTNNRDAGDLRRHCTHYDVTVMKKSLWRVNGRIGPPWHFQSRLPFNTLRPRQTRRHFACDIFKGHCDDVTMSLMASQITSLTIVYSTVYSDADLRKHQSSASLAFVRGNHRGPVNSPHKWPVMRKMFPFYDVIMHFLEWKYLNSD